MRFSKTGDIYKISKMTRNKDSVLGISFSENSEETTQVIEINISKMLKRSFEKEVNKGAVFVNTSTCRALCHSYLE